MRAVRPDDAELISEAWILDLGFVRVPSPMGPEYSDHFQKDELNVWLWNGESWRWDDYCEVEMFTRGKLRDLADWMNLDFEKEVQV